MDPIAILRKRAKNMSQKALATELGISQQYLCDVLAGRREPGDGILAPLGLEKVTCYRRKKSTQSVASNA